MNKGIKYAFAFVLGAAAGSFVTWKFLKTKYEQIAQEEIESVREVYRTKLNIMSEGEPEPEQENSKDDSEYFVYEDMAGGYNTTTDEEKGGSEVATDDAPYLITPGQFAEIDDYEVEDLLYFADGVLTDDAFNAIDNIESLVIPDFAKHFGDYDYDQYTVYVRNDRLKTDYEILRDTRKYSEVVLGNSNPTGEE